MDVDALAVCVLAAAPRDAERTCAVLRDRGVGAISVASFSELGALIGRGPAGVGALLLTERAVPPAGWAELAVQLAAQPPWSDLPVIVAARRRPGADQDGLEDLRAAGAGHLTVIEAPVRVPTVVSAAQAALRARKRQYEVRDLLHRLEDADRRKDEFLAMLGHELRNPLAAMQMAVQLKQLQSPAVATDRQSQVIERQLRSLNRIVDDLLDVSRVTMGKLQLTMTPVDLCDAVRRCVQAVAGEAERSRLELGIATPSEREPVMIRGDIVRVDQILANVVTNAIKYTPAGGRIDVGVELGGENDPLARVIVRDTGIGIDAATLPHIFDLFAQAQQGLARSRGGLGLGLALVKKLVELHGGEVTAASGGHMQGSTLTLQFPLSATVRQPALDSGTAARRLA